MIVMKGDATQQQVAAVIERIERAGARAHVSAGEFVTVIGAIGDDRELIAALDIEGEGGVERVVPILKPYKLVSKDFRGDAPVEIAGRLVGGENFCLIAGPCTVESRAQTLDTADVVKSVGVTMLRGGAFKPRSSPYTFQGLGREALTILAEARERTGLPIVTEVMDVRQIEDVVEVADVIQLGARNMQNFDLLKEVGRTGTAVLLLVKPCVRCTVPSVDPDSGAQGHAVSDVLAAFRADARMDGGITFGMNAVIVDGIDRTLRVGQSVRGTYRF